MNANVQFLRRPPEFKYARLEGWLVDVPANSLTRDDADVRLTPKAMSVLRELIGRQGTVVRRDDLLGLVWRDGFPTDDVLTHAITELRRALDDDPRSPRIIETIPKVGYRLLSRAELLDGLPDDGRAAAAEAAAAIPSGGSERVRPWAMAIALAALVAVAIVVPRWRASDPDVVDASKPLAADAAWLSAGLRPFAVTSDQTREQFPSLSPDGGTVAYVAVRADGMGSHIALKSLDSAGVAVKLTDPPDEIADQMPTWSPDGKQIAFLRMSEQACMIHVMPALGGAARAVTPCPARIFDYIDWSADGHSLLLSRRAQVGSNPQFPRSGTITRLEMETGKLVPLVYAPQGLGEDDLQPKASPDGRLIAFRRGAAPYSDLFVMPADGGDARRLTFLRARIRGYTWYPDSRYLLLSSDHAGRQSLYRLDTTSGDTIALGLHDAHFPSMAAKAPVAVYQAESELMQMAEVRLTGSPTVSPAALAPSTRSDWFPTLSPSGARVAFISMRTGSQQLWIHEFEDQRTYPVTRVEQLELGFPQWSPDESEVLVIARGGGNSRVLRVRIGSGHSEWLSPEAERVRWASYMLDGSRILFSSDRAGTWQVWRMLPDGSGAEQLSRTGGFDPRDFLGDGGIYYTKETDPGLFRLDLQTRDERRVSWHAGYWNMDALRVFDDGLYFLDSQGEGSGLALVRAPLQLEGVTGEPSESEMATERVLRIEGLPIAGQMTISSDKTRLVTVAVIRDETDLMAVNLAAPDPQVKQP